VASFGSQGQRVSRAVDWLKANFASPLGVWKLAQQVQIGPSSFRNHFSRLTSMIPLQSLRRLRLKRGQNAVAHR
jgi:transcriptional regulator GlxA family with amidase domain